MTIADLAAVGTFLAAAGGFVAAVGAFVVARRNRKAGDAAKLAAELAADAALALKAKVVEIDGSVYQLGQRVDGRLSELLAASSAQARAEGQAAGEQTQRERGPGQ